MKKICPSKDAYQTYRDLIEIKKIDQVDRHALKSKIIRHEKSLARLRRDEHRKKVPVAKY